MPETLAVAALMERLSHCACGEGYRDGLKPTQWSALRYFSQANRFSCTTTAFARFQGTSIAAASQTIGALVERDLLKRAGDPADKRKHYLSLTSAAAELIDTDPLRILAGAVAVLAQHEQVDLKRQLERMLQHLSSERIGPAFGYCGDCRFLRCRREGAGAGAYRCAHLDEALEEQEINHLCANFERGPAPD